MSEHTMSQDYLRTSKIASFLSPIAARTRVYDSDTLLFYNIIIIINYY